MKKLLAVLFLLVVNVLNLSTVNAAQVVRISDFTLDQYLLSMRALANSDIVQSRAQLNFSDPTRLEQNDRANMQLKCWTSTVSADSKNIGAIFFSVDNQNLVSALEIFIADQGDQEKNMKVFYASMACIFVPLQLSKTEFDNVIEGIFSERDPVWCEKSQRYIAAQITDGGILTVVALVE